MLEWKIEDGLITELRCNSTDNLIYPWGVENADEWSFFSLERKVGYRYTRKNEVFRSTINENHVEMECLMRQGHYSLKLDEKIQNESLSRHLVLEALEDTRLMDFVLRFRFKKEYFSSAKIADQVLEHKNTNVYYQYPVNEAFLEGDLGKIHIQVLESSCPKAFSPYLYVRDRGDEWIIHARMLPQEWNRECIKICNGFFRTSPLPQFLSRFLLSIPMIRRALWYRGEKAPFHNKILRWLNLNAFPFSLVKKGQKLEWNVQMSWYKN